MKKILISLFFIVSLGSCSRQEKEKIICRYSAESTLPGDATLHQTDAKDVEAVAGMIMEFTGLPQNFSMEQVDWGNAAAFITKDKKGNILRKITYRPEFFLRLNDETGNYWASISILAHEIGHHLAGHTEKIGARPEYELEADRFSGFILNRMGASLDDARTAINTVVKSKSATASGLTKEKRLEAILDGWALAEKNKDSIITIPGKYPQVSVRNLKEEELTPFTTLELRIMIGEIYARHGYKFRSDPDLFNYFNTTDWYYHIPPANHGVEWIYNNKLSRVEKKNLAVIQNVINKKSKGTVKP